MNILKLIVAAAAMALFAQPASAQDSKMDHGQMDHSKMDHSKMDHGEPEPAALETPDFPKDAATENAEVIVAKVNGLVCDFCAQTLKKVFKKEAAVDSLDVNLGAGEVHIALKPGETLADARVKNMIRNSGYSLVSTHRINAQ